MVKHLFLYEISKDFTISGTFIDDEEYEKIYKSIIHEKTLTNLLEKI
ncbi:MAG: hypothetical protein M0R46_06520 [Candidatus Muirbacterium halophilum]|nr:hypothetical protein [Candidatus Muirbacterium halophilum]